MIRPPTCPGNRNRYNTSLKHAWIEGSLESAIRVALEVKEVTSLSD